MLKEPTAIRQFLTVSYDVAHADTAEDLLARLTGVLEHVSGCPHEIELKQLTRQGSGRFTGVAAWCKALGVLEDDAAQRKPATASAASRGQEDGVGVVYIGLMQKRCRILRGCPDRLRSFVTLCGNFQVFKASDAARSNDLEVWVRALEVPLRALKAEFKWTNYVVQHLMRKLLLAASVHHGAALQTDWAAMSLPALRQCAPDAAEYISVFPPTLYAADASDMVLGRRDWGLFLSLWGCLFHEAGELWPKRKDDMLRALSSKQSGDAIRRFREIHGIAPCPTVLVSILLGELIT